MKHILVILFISLLCIRAFAGTTQLERSVVFRSYQHVDTISYEERMTKLKEEIHYYRGMKATGGSLTGLGIAFFAAGQGMLWSSITLNQSGRRSYSPTARDPLFLAGLGTTLLTAVPLAFGVPLLRYGTKKVKQLKKQLPRKDLQ